MKIFSITAIVVLAWAIVATDVHGQAGVSSSSFGVARSGVHNRFGDSLMPPPEFFRVEEFVNYHRHDLPLPTGNKKVRLNVQQMELEDDKTLLQFGITTPRAIGEEDLPPLNVVLVIDESGSMSGEKMEKLKEALSAFVDRFRSSDSVAIVGFENKARLILPATKKTETQKIRAAIDDITAGGGTNLHAGLMMGYREALENFDAERTNRVIFLTDGNANVGETHAAEIAAESKRCINKGISLVTIGLGVDFNNGLLREIADSGRGTMHYIGDAKDIRKTFVKEVDSLLAPAATKVRLEIKLDDASKAKVFGYKKKLDRSDDKLVLNLDDLNCGATQVVLMKFSGEEMIGEATLKYVDAITKEKVEVDVDLEDVDGASSASINRNYAISKIAGGLNASADFYQEGRRSKAEEALKSALRKARKYRDLDDDSHVRRVAKIANGYLEKLSSLKDEHRPEPVESKW